MSNELFYEHRAVSRTGNPGAGSVVVPAITAEQMEGLHFTPTPRAGDEHRQRYLAHLGELFALGYIDQAEHDARTAIAAGAPTKATLAALLGDLPALSVPEKTRPPLGERWRKRLLTTASGRAVLHAAVAVLMLAVAIAVPTTVATHHGWGHSPADVFVLAVSIIAGVIGFIANLVLLCVWVDA